MGSYRKLYTSFREPIRNGSNSAEGTSKLRGLRPFIQGRNYRIRARIRFSASSDQYLQSSRMNTDEYGIVIVVLSTRT